jgi:hypothetical protein
MADRLPLGVCRQKVHMACRIDRLVTEDGAVVMKISGRLTAHDVEMFRTLLETDAGVIAFDLRDLVFADRDAVGLLARSEAAGGELRNCPPYIREWITQARTQAKPDGEKRCRRVD